MSIENCVVCNAEVERETFNANDGFCAICINVEPTETKYIWRSGNSWYFSDEMEQLNGRFASEQLAIEALEKYCEWLNGTQVESTNPNPFLSQEGAISNRRLR